MESQLGVLHVPITTTTWKLNTRLITSSFNKMFSHCQQCSCECQQQY